MAGTLRTYIITNNADGTTFELEADRVEKDTSTGYVNFYEAEELVASLINISFRRKPSGA